MASESKGPQHAQKVSACVDTKQMTDASRFVYVGNRKLVVQQPGKHVLEVLNADDLSAPPNTVDLWSSSKYDINLIDSFDSVGDGTLYTLGYRNKQPYSGMGCGALYLIGEWTVNNDGSLSLNRVASISLHFSLRIAIQVLNPGQLIITSRNRVSVVSLDTGSVAWMRDFSACTSSPTVIVGFPKYPELPDKNDYFGVFVDTTFMLFSLRSITPLSCVSTEKLILSATFVKEAGLLVCDEKTVVRYCITEHDDGSVHIKEKLDKGYLRLGYLRQDDSSSSHYRPCAVMNGRAGNFIVSDSNSIRLCLVNQTSFTCIGSLGGHTEPIRFMQQGERDELLSRDQSGVLKRWDLSKHHMTSQLVQHRDTRAASRSIVVDENVYYVTKGTLVYSVKNFSGTVVMEVPLGRVLGMCAAGSDYLLVCIEPRPLVTKPLKADLPNLQFKQSWFDRVTDMTTVSGTMIVVCCEDKSIKMLSYTYGCLSQVFCVSLQIGPIRELQHLGPGCVYCPQVPSLVISCTPEESAVRSVHGHSVGQPLVLDSSGNVVQLSESVVGTGTSAFVLGPGSFVAFNRQSMYFVTQTDGSWTVGSTVELFDTIMSVTKLTDTVLVVTCECSGVHLYDMISQNVVSS